MSDGMSYCLEDLEQFLLRDLAILVGVDCIDKPLHICLCNLLSDF
jgi:hypothetical protein